MMQFHFRNFCFCSWSCSAEFCSWSENDCVSARSWVLLLEISTGVELLVGLVSSLTILPLCPALICTVGICLLADRSSFCIFDVICLHHVGVTSVGLPFSLMCVLLRGITHHVGVTNCGYRAFTVASCAKGWRDNHDLILHTSFYCMWYRTCTSKLYRQLSSVVLNGLVSFYITLGRTWWQHVLL
jgi:hypothetical protein